jgi:hypothetical protein
MVALVPLGQRPAMDFLVAAARFIGTCAPAARVLAVMGAEVDR